MSSDNLNPSLDTGMINMLPIGAWSLVDATNSFSYNNNFTEVLGLPPQKQMSFEDFITQVIYPDDKVEVQKQIKAVVAQERKSLNIDCRITTTNHLVRWINIKGQSMSTGNAHCGIVGTLQDITQSKACEKLIDKLQFKIKSQNERLINLGNIVSHDLISHANNLCLLIEAMTIGSQNQGDDELHAMLQKSAKSLKQNISNVYDGIAIQTQTRQVKEEIILQPFIDKLIDNLNERLNTDDVFVKNETTDDTVVQAIPNYLDNIISELITNAIQNKSNERSCHIHIKSEMVSNGVILLVKDNGVGIDMNHVGPKVFNMNVTSSSVKDAKGLGLYIVKNQIEAMDGTISVDSEINRYTTFKFFLPNE